MLNPVYSRVACYMVINVQLRMTCVHPKASVQTVQCKKGMQDALYLYYVLR